MDKSAFHKISYGLYIVSSVKDGKFNGQIANTVFQVTSEPPTIAVSINKKNLTHAFIANSKVFAISVLSTQATMQFIGRFGFKSGRDIDKFADADFEVGKSSGCPLVKDFTIANLEAKVIDSFDAGTHTLFLGEITDAKVLSSDYPITYDYYHKVKKGRAPKNAPTYLADEKDLKKEEKKMDTYVCTVCGYVYDPEIGDPENDIPPGTSFEDLPDDWVCPVCGADKDSFEKEE